MTWTHVAWRNARHFCEHTVPEKARSRIWDWIANQAESKWMSRAGTRQLHRYKKRQQTIHRIARIIAERYAGDARKIWSERRSTPLLQILEDDLRVGPGIARMIVGALRDHQLVTLRRSDFKPDRHVIRLMSALGLASSTRWRDVLKSAELHFEDPWLADACFYHLGAEYGVKTRKQFLAAYAAVRRWTRVRTAVKARFAGCLAAACKSVGSVQWERFPEHTFHWAAAYLVVKHGSLKAEMEKESLGGLWVWIGVGFDGRLAVGLDIGGHERFFEPGGVRQSLSGEGMTAVRGGIVVAKGAREYWRTWPIDVASLRNDGQLIQALDKAVAAAGRVVKAIELAQEGKP
jgi:hypothetical protein